MLSARGGRLAEFRVHGPFPLVTRKRSHSRVLDREALPAFWRQNADLQQLAHKCGCYVFAMRAGKGYTPYYVGQTTAEFARECFNTRNIANYDKVLAEYGKSCGPVLFLISNRSRKRKPRLIREIEGFFIELGAARNPNLTQREGQADREVVDSRRH